MPVSPLPEKITLLQKNPLLLSSRRLSRLLFLSPIETAPEVIEEEVVFSEPAVQEIVAEPVTEYIVSEPVATADHCRTCS